MHCWGVTTGGMPDGAAAPTSEPTGLNAAVISATGRAMRTPSVRIGMLLSSRLCSEPRSPPAVHRPGAARRTCGIAHRSFQGERLRTTASIAVNRSRRVDSFRSASVEHVRRCLPPRISSLCYSTPGGVESESEVDDTHWSRRTHRWLAPDRKVTSCASAGNACQGATPARARRAKPPQARPRSPTTTRTQGHPSRKADHSEGSQYAPPATPLATPPAGKPIRNRLSCTRWHRGGSLRRAP